MKSETCEVCEARKTTMSLHVRDEKFHRVVSYDAIWICRVCLKITLQGLPLSLPPVKRKKR